MNPIILMNNFYGTWLHLLKLKDKNLESKIKKLVGQRIGIHVRHFSKTIDDPRKDLIPRFDYESKMEYLKKVLDKYPNDKFFISSDVTYDKPSTENLCYLTIVRILIGYQKSIMIMMF